MVSEMTKAMDPRAPATGPEAPAKRRRRLLGYLVPVAVLAILAWAAFEIIGLRVVRVSRRAVALSQAEAPPAEMPAGAESTADPEAETPRNLILVIADGFGFAHLTAARTVLHGINGSSVWDRFGHVGWQWTHPAAGFINDSAAGATALATGQPTHYGSIGVDVDGQPLETLFDRAADLGYRTGIVTDSYVWDATPAAFVTHSPVRGNENAGATLKQLGESSLEILVGELEDVGEDEVPEWQASVELLGRRFEVLGPEADAALLRRLETADSPTVAIFEEDQVTDLESEPDLPALAGAALRRLSSGERPFVLLIESEEPDSAAHKNDFGRLLRGLAALEATLEMALDFAAENGETLVVFTADHESGGLALGIADYYNNRLEAVWASRDHTGVVVPVLAVGPGAEAFAGSHANWELGRLLGRTLRQPERSEAPPG